MSYRGVTIKDNSAEFDARFKKGMTKALYAIGATAVEITLDYMTNKYYKDIHLTGDLKRDLNYKPRLSDNAVDIGNSLNYAVAVHEGTGRMVKRPYLKDAIYENTKLWQEIFAEYIGSEVEGKTAATSFTTA